MGVRMIWHAGPCLWCGQWVESRREEAGAPAESEAYDACWATEDGDFGCNMSPDSSEDGCGDHARPQDPMLRAAGPLYESLKWAVGVAEVTLRDIHQDSVLFGIFSKHLADAHAAMQKAHGR